MVAATLLVRLTGLRALSLDQRVGAIRKQETALTHGEVSVFAAAEDNAGLLVTKRTHKGETIYVIFNTANHAIFVDDVTLAPGDSQRLEVLMASHNDTRFISHNGDLRGVIPERGVYLLKLPRVRRMQRTCLIWRVT